MGRRGNGEGSIYFQASRQRYAGAITLENGKRVVFYGKTRQAVHAKLTAALESKSNGSQVVVSQQKLGAYLTHWLDTVVRPNREPRTYWSYEQLVRVHIVPVLGRVPLAKLSPQDVQRLLNHARESGLSARSVQYVHAVLRMALNQAVKWGLVGRNVALLVDVPRARRPRIEPFSPEQARALLEAAAGTRHGYMLTVMIATGLRLGETLALRWEDIDFEHRLLRVRHTLEQVNRRPWRLKPPKSERSQRLVPLLKPALAALQGQRQHVNRLREVADAWQEYDFVFPSTAGTPLSARNLERDFALLLERSGLPSKRLHDLRHSTGTYLIAAGVHPRVVMELLGHSQISITMDTYGHVLAPSLGEAIAHLEALFPEVSQPAD
jgi:integrase